MGVATRWRPPAVGPISCARTRTSSRAATPPPRRRPPPSKAAPLAPAAPPPKPVKLTFKDQHRLSEAERQIHDLPAEIAKLETVLADPALFTKNPAKFDQTMKAIDAARATLERAEEDWLMLEEKRAGLL